MADNFAFTPGSGAVGAGDEIGGVMYQRVKISVGADGSATDMSAGAGAVAAGTPRITHASDDPAVTALELIDDAIKADDAAFTPGTTKVMMAGFEYDDTTPDSVDEGDAGAARMSARREIYVQLRDAAGNERGANIDSSGRIGVNISSGGIAAGAITTGATSIAAAEDDASANLDTGVKILFKRTDTPANSSGTDGDYEQPQMSAGRLWVAAGQAAHDAAIAGNPVRTGARARTSNVTAVSADDQVDSIATLVGAQITKPYSIPEADWAYAAAGSGILNTTTAVTIAAAAGAGLRNYVTWIDIMAEALGTATEVAIRDGAGGTVLWRTKIATAGLLAGRFIQLPSPIKSTANTLLEVVTITASGSGAVYFNAGGFIAP